MFENNPALREGLLCLCAFSAILIAGAISVDFLLTSGMQFGDAAVATPAPARLAVISDEWQSYSPPAQRARLISVQPTASFTDGATTAEGLDGGANATTATSDQTATANATTLAEDDLSAHHAAAAQSFEQIEAQIAEADPSAAAPPTKTTPANGLP